MAADSAASSIVSEPYVQQPAQQPSSPSTHTALQPKPEVAGSAQSAVPNTTATTASAEDSSQHDSQHSSMPEQQHGSSIPPSSSRPLAAAPAQSVPRQNGVAPGPPSDGEEVVKLRSQLQRLKAQLVASANSAEEDAERQAAAAGQQASTLQRQRDELQASLHAAQQQLAAQQAARAEVGAPLIVKQAVIAPAGDRQLLVGAAARHSIRHILWPYLRYYHPVQAEDRLRDAEDDWETRLEAHAAEAASLRLELQERQSAPPQPPADAAPAAAEGAAAQQALRQEAEQAEARACHWQASAEAAQADVAQLQAELDAARHASMPSGSDTSADAALQDAQQAAEAAQQQAAQAASEAEQQRAAVAAAAADAESAQQELDVLRQRVHSLEATAAVAAEVAAERQRARQQAEHWQAAADAAQAAAAEAEQRAEAMGNAANQASLQCEALASHLAAEQEAHAAVQQQLSDLQVIPISVELFCLDTKHAGRTKGLVARRLQCFYLVSVSACTADCCSAAGGAGHAAAAGSGASC